MIEQPHPDTDTYSVAARICLGVAVFSTALLIAAVLTSAIVIE